MNCSHCEKEFQPKQKYCSTNCRVYAHQKRKGPIQPESQKSSKPVVTPSDDHEKHLKVFTEAAPKFPKDQLQNIAEKHIPEHKTFVRKRGELDPSDYL